MNSKKKEPFDGGEARCAEKEEPEVTVVIGSEMRDHRRERGNNMIVRRRKIKMSSTSVDQSRRLSENNTPIWVYRKKGEKAMGKLSVGSREKAITDDETAIETQFEDLSIKSGEEKGETKNLKAQTRSSNRNRINQRHDLPPRRVRMPIRDVTMVWVKKEPNDGAINCIAFA